MLFNKSVKVYNVENAQQVSANKNKNENTMYFKK